MPQDNLHTETQYADQPRGESLRSERRESTRSEPSHGKSAPVYAGDALIMGMSSKNMKAGLRMQQEMFDMLQDIGRDWLARATSEAEFAFKLPNKLTSVRTIPDALLAYQEWLSEWLRNVH